MWQRTKQAFAYMRKAYLACPDCFHRSDNFFLLKRSTALGTADALEHASFTPPCRLLNSYTGMLTWGGSTSAATTAVCTFPNRWLLDLPSCQVSGRPAVHSVNPQLLSKPRTSVTFGRICRSCTKSMVGRAVLGRCVPGYKVRNAHALLVPIGLLAVGGIAFTFKLIFPSHNGWGATHGKQDDEDITTAAFSSPNFRPRSERARIQP